MIRRIELRAVPPVLMIWNALFAVAGAETQWLVDSPVHLRSGNTREWDEFPAQADGRHLDRRFTATASDGPSTLELVQYDVKQDWQLAINDVPLGRLRINENRMRVYFEVPAGILRIAENKFQLTCLADRSRPSDDIRVGPIRLHNRPRTRVLSETRIEVSVRDRSRGIALPSRLTVLDADGNLQTTSAESTSELAVRPGVIYSSSGAVSFAVPAGTYTIHAGHGFEYSMATQRVVAAPDQTVSINFKLDHQVPTPGMVACDPHVHTLTHSGHGDATVHERMITLAAEGIELPVATDHNVNIDHEPFARRAGVRQYFTPVIGNEFTTRIGHFNIWPIDLGATPPDTNADDWREAITRVFATPHVKIAILNHPRDRHAGFLPFGPARHLAMVGRNLDDWGIEFNGVELVNSSATQNDVLQPFHDWLALLNRGQRVTPVGSSDSHDVARHFVGQSRTYIRCDDSDPSAIDVDQVVRSFLAGRVAVAYGLLPEMRVAGRYQAGEKAVIVGDRIPVDVRVLAPHWIQVDRVALYANGKPVWEELIDTQSRASDTAGVAWQGTVQLTLPTHDVCLVLMALGPGIENYAWRTAKPYMPTSSRWTSRVFGCTGPVWIDVDRDGRWSSAMDYACQIVRRSRGDVASAIARLAGYDQAVALQLADQLCQESGNAFPDDVWESLNGAPAHVRDAFKDYAESWRASQRARAEAGLASFDDE